MVQKYTEPYHKIGADFVHVDIHLPVESTTRCQVAQHPVYYLNKKNNANAKHNIS